MGPQIFFLWPYGRTSAFSTFPFETQRALRNCYVAKGRTKKNLSKSTSLVTLPTCHSVGAAINSPSLTAAVFPYPATGPAKNSLIVDGQSLCAVQPFWRIFMPPSWAIAGNDFFILVWLPGPQVKVWPK